MREMIIRRPQLTRSALWAYAAVFVGLHAFCILLFRAHAAEASSPFLVLAPAIASLVCIWRARHSATQVGLLWSLLSLAFFIWTVAAVVSAREEFILNTPVDLGAGSQILYFMYGVPVLLTIASQTEGTWNTLFLWLGGIQVAIMGFLIYVVIFNVVPFTHQPLQPISGRMVAFTFNIENLVLACASTLRFVTAPVQKEERRFYRSLTAFLWLYALSAALYNYVNIAFNGPVGLYDVIIDLPFITLAVLALLHAPSETIPPVSRRGETFALLLVNGSPVLFPATVLALGISVARHHFKSGVGSIALSLAVYGVRSTLLQIGYQRAQAEVKSARDAMEILSLTDPLTGVGNRRHFDRVFQAEWNRLSRQRGPLSLLLVDIDHFKLFNDTFGHVEGDLCLRQVAQALAASVQREFDILARYGGEEFAAILPGTDKSGAESVARLMRSMVGDLKLRNKTPLGETITISIGASTCDLPCNGSLDALFEASDRALYHAKQTGRDRIEHESMQVFEYPLSKEVPA